MSQFNFTIDTTRFDSWLSTRIKRQLPFALAKGLTKTAQLAQDDVRKALPSYLTIRNTWTEKGIRIKPATKRDLTAHIYSIDKNIKLQVTGGTKRPEQGKSIGIAASSKGRIEARTKGTFTGKIRKALKPRTILDDEKLYFRSNKIKGLDAIWKRTGRKDSKGWPRGKLKLTYVLRPSVRIKKRFPFADIVERTATHHLSTQIIQAIESLD